MTQRYNRAAGIVTVTADDGTVRDWPLAEFEADPAGCVAQTGNGITPPVIEPTVDDKIAAVRAEYEEKLARLEKRNNAVEAVLREKAIVTKEEVDAKEVIDPKGGGKLEPAKR